MAVSPVNFKEAQNKNIKSDFEKKEIIHDNKPSSDEGMKTSTKLMLGASALAVTTIAGILLHKGIVSKRAAKETEILINDLKHKKQKIEQFYKEPAIEKELAERLEEIDKLSAIEQKDAYEALVQAIKQFQQARIYGIDKINLRRGMQEIPQDVKKEIDAGNWIKAGELYEEYVQKLPNTFRAKNIGATVEESIKNVFGSESKVKPHTYDLSKEGNEIISLRYYGGYYDVVATKEGILYESPHNLELINAFGNGGQHLASTTPIGDKATIVHGVDKNGKYVTILKMPDPRKVDVSGDNLKIDLGLISNGKKPTPAQQDLLSLAKNPEKFDVNLIDELTLKTNPGVDGAENFDYNLTLSVIQSMAGK